MSTFYSVLINKQNIRPKFIIITLTILPTNTMYALLPRYKNYDMIIYLLYQKLIFHIIQKIFRLIKCQNCDYFSIPKKAHKTLYCDVIFEDGKTCKEYAESLAFSRIFANDPVCKRYRNRYRNLNKQASLSNNSEVQILYEKYKSDGSKMLEKYRHGKITAEEFEDWIDSMKIKK